MKKASISPIADPWLPSPHFQGSIITSCYSILQRYPNSQMCAFPFFKNAFSHFLGSIPFCHSAPSSFFMAA